MTIYVITTGVCDYDGSWTSIVGVTYDEEVAKRIVADRNGRIAAAVTNREAIQDHMVGWDKANPRPQLSSLGRLKLPFEKIPKKDRTPEMVAANEKAKKDHYERQAEESYPYKSWCEARYAEQCRFTEETFSEAERADLSGLSRDEVCEYEEAKELT